MDADGEPSSSMVDASSAQDAPNTPSATGDPGASSSMQVDDSAAAMDADGDEAGVHMPKAPTTLTTTYVAAPPGQAVATAPGSTAAVAKLLPQQVNEIIMPSYSAWFSLGHISPVEEKALPEFFSGKNKSKTPSVYRDYRDFMVGCML